MTRPVEDGRCHTEKSKENVPPSRSNKAGHLSQLHVVFSYGAPSCSVSNRPSATLLHRHLLLTKWERKPRFYLLAHSPVRAKAPWDNSVTPASSLTPRACEGGRYLIFQSRLCPQVLTALRSWDERLLAPASAPFSCRLPQESCHCHSTYTVPAISGSQT